MKSAAAWLRNSTKRPFAASVFGGLPECVFRLLTCTVCKTFGFGETNAVLGARASAAGTTWAAG